MKDWVKQLTRQRGYTDQMVEDANAVIFTFGSYHLGVSRSSVCSFYDESNPFCFIYSAPRYFWLGFTDVFRVDRCINQVIFAWRIFWFSTFIGGSTWIILSSGLRIQLPAIMQYYLWRYIWNGENQIQLWSTLIYKWQEKYLSIVARSIWRKERNFC